MGAGLDGIVAAETMLSHVDGEAGRLIVRGHELRELAGRASFEEVLGLLWDETVTADGLGGARERAFAFARDRVAAADGLSPVEGLRFLLAGLPDAAPEPHALLAVAAMPVFAAALDRRARGLAPVAPDGSLGHAADFLRMLRGTTAPASHARALDTYLVTVADHGMNASTFAARVIASTRAGLLSAVVGGLCALKGPLHGGAPGPVLDMLDAIGTPDRIEPWLGAALDRGERLMGFGHRIYRVRDPRADVLKPVAAGLAASESAGGNRIRFAEQVEAAAQRLLAQRKPGRPLQTNVEFYTALVLEALELPRALFTPVFAIGRVAGWTAHILEQERDGRIIRPQSAYVGPMPRVAC